jgi:hypothetical protein
MSGLTFVVGAAMSFLGVTYVGALAVVGALPTARGATSIG